MSNLQTENSFFESKCLLRIAHLPKKNKLTVMDAFSADGKIWEEIKKRTKLDISILRIEKKKDKKGLYLQGDNQKYLAGMDLNRFDIIDVDAFGVPYKQLKILFQKKYQGIVFVTFIQSLFGGLPYEMLADIGYPIKMIRKCPAIFFMNGIDKFCMWLATNGIKKVSIMSHGKKYYIFFSTHCFLDVKHL